MQPPDGAPEGVTAATRVAPSTSMLEALRRLHRAFQRSSIYPEGHPAVPRALDETLRLLHDALESAASVRITAGRNHLTLDGDRLDDPGGTLGALAALLHGLDLAAVEFRAGIAREELETLVRALGQARREGLRGAAFVERFGDRMHHVELTPIDYSALRFREGQRDADETAGEDLWASLGEMLTHPPEAAGSVVEPEVMARSIDRDIEAGAEIDVVRERITGLSRQINEARPERRAAGRGWLTRFVAALNPRLRRDLLRIDPKLPGSSLEVVHELADVIPEKELFDALQKIDRAGGRLPSQFMTLMNKLMRLSPQRSERPGPGRAATSRGPRGDLREALREVLQRRGSAEFNPRPYQTLLDGLAVQSLTGGDTPSTAIYRDPRDADDVLLHAAEVAVRLAAQPGGERHRAGVFRRVAEETERLLAGHRLDELRDAAVSARGYSLHKHAAEPTRLAAKSFLERFRSERCIALVLDQARSANALSDAAKVLLELGGVTALGKLLDALNDRLPRPIEAAFQSAAAERGPDELRRVLRWRAERGWEALRPLFPVLRLLEPEAAAELLEQLLAHDEFEVRREALLTLVAGERTEALLPALRRGLADPDPRLVTLVVRSLAELRDDRAVELLGRYIEGGLPATPPSLECATLAARCLARRGEPGVERLGDCLDRLSRRYRPLMVRLAFRVREELRPLVGSAGLDDRLRRWRFSPAWLVGWLTPGKRARGRGDEP